ncbi:MAG TPA: alpha/beta fold hydrolase [Gemmatimonadales bacterium]|nr:alpha/beta fold hydrolase [Gemmatimonadales bacterium]
MSRAPARVLALRAVFSTVGSVAPGIAARWAESMFCTPPKHQPRTSDESFLATGRHFTVRSEAQELAVWEWGEGPTIVLVHGWGSRAGRFSVMAGALADSGFRVVAYDAPAHGRSTGRFASLPEFARALRSVGDAVGPVFGLVGHSLGGAAATLALRDGLAAERVVLLAAPADVTRFSTAFADYLRLPPETRATMRKNLETRLQARWDELHLPTIARSLRARALLVHDHGDTDVPYGQGVEIAAAWPGARLVGTNGLGHRAILRDPAVVGEAIAFLQAAAPR